MANKIRSWGSNKDEVNAHIKIANGCKHGIVELGVLFGETSRLFCQANPDVWVIGIDPLIPDSMNPNLIGDIDSIRKNTDEYSNFIFIHDYSYNRAENFPWKFDYIFIDASHEYKDVALDYAQWFPKLEPGGHIAFHDSTNRFGGPDNWDGPSFFIHDIINNGFSEIQFNHKYLYTLSHMVKPELVDMVHSLTIFKKCG